MVEKKIPPSIEVENGKMHRASCTCKLKLLALLVVEAAGVVEVTVHAVGAVRVVITFDTDELESLLRQTLVALQGKLVFVPI